MAFPLQQLEQHINDEFLLLGEQLFERGEVQALRELERHLWAAQVEQTYEVEIKITPSRVDLTSCECPGFMTHGECAHVAASLLALRKHIQQNTSAARVEQPKNANKQRLTTRGVLKNLEEEELKEFVRQYASRDRNFALALKARFAATVSFSDDKSKYLQVLEETIRAARKKDRSISYRGMQTLIKVSDELLLQAESALVQGYFRTVILIAQSIIEKITPVLRKMGQYQDSARSRISKSFEMIHQVLGLQAPPELVEELWQYAGPESKKVTYRINEIVPQFYRLLSKVSTQLDEKEALLTLLEEARLLAQFSDRNYTSLLINKIEILEGLNRLEEVNTIIQENQQNGELLLYVLNRGLKRGDVEWVKQLADQMLENELPTTIREQIEEVRLLIAEEESDDKTIQQYSYNRLLKTHKMRYFDILKEQQTDDWETKREGIIEAIKKQPYSPQRRDLVATIYVKEEAWKLLINYLEETKSLDMLSAFTKDLLPTYKKQVYKIYELLIEDYLSNHFGRTAAKRVGERIVYLRRIQAHTVAEKLLRYVRKAYSDRASLMDELSIL